MLSLPATRFAYAVVTLAGLVGVPWLAVITLKQVVSIGTAEAWMLVGVLAIVAGLPLLLLALTAVDWLQRRLHRYVTIPHTGGNVP
ncbi:hypothetical protein [Solilutibacter silvestris]|uniref:Uncharacterized protein n=1 Tax=Solilutibacter silvestris TaxID=1645665 RepID=A0A2K1PXX4_9GAMM|nr:hypothetical protein [Lysobacter silvestris]PNS07631.1 hypothetical protein Lysil_1807 [Lysobacter silvestris]